MAKYIPLEQAAEMLGIPVDKLTEMLSNNEIFGYKDGKTWKFKQQELERVADELELKLGNGTEPADDDDDLSFDLDDSSAEIADDSIDLDELDLSSSEGLILDDESSDALQGDEEEDDALSFGSSSLKLAGSESADLLDDDEPKETGSPSDTGKMSGSGGDDLLLSEESLFTDDLSLEDSYEDSAELSSDFEDSELILEDSDSDSELSLGGKGVSLAPNESGISLDDSMELGGSDIDSLELPADEDMIVLDDAADPEAATIMQEDDFNLTPLEEAMDDDTSGSQIIALEDSEIYTDESSATILADSDDLEAEPAMLVDSAISAEPVGYDSTVGAGAVPGGPAVGAAPTLPEAPYTIWQVGGLILVLAILLPGAMVAYDLARNMWLPDDQLVSSGIVLDFLLGIIGMK